MVKAFAKRGPLHQTRDLKLRRSVLFIHMQAKETKQLSEGKDKRMSTAQIAALQGRRAYVTYHGRILPGGLFVPRRFDLHLGRLGSGSGPFRFRFYCSGSGSSSGPVNRFLGRAGVFRVEKPRAREELVPDCADYAANGVESLRISDGNWC